MEIDLARLREMHTRLPVDLALSMATRAGLALERNGHAAGVSIPVEVDRAAVHGILLWPQSKPHDSEHHDYNRVTEDGAEAVALAIASRHRGWRIVRRMQREEHGDWLMEETGAGRRHLVAFEISGVDRGSILGRLGEKLVQVSKSRDADQSWAGVVGLKGR